jgi:hypothetical protein
MTASLIDHLPLDDQPRLLWAASAVLLFSIALLLAGVTFARVLVAATLGVLLASGTILLGSIYAPSFSPITLGIMGFAVGLIAGAILYAIVQSLIAGIYCGLVTVLIGVNWSTSSAASSTASQPASDLLLTIRPPLRGWAAVKQMLLDHLQHLSGWHLTAVMVAAVVVTLAVLLICLIYPRGTTVIVTALLGAGTALVAAVCIGLVRHWAIAGTLAEEPLMALGVGLLVAALGAGFQWRFFVRRNDRPKRARATAPPNGPAADSAA